MRRLFATDLLAAAGVVALGLSGCASDDAAKKSDPPPTEDPAPSEQPAEQPAQPADQPAARPEQPAEPAAQPAEQPAAEPEKKEEEPTPEPNLTPAQEAAAGRNPDGIDDENPVPTRDGPVKTAFVNATKTAGSNPAQAMQEFAAVAKQNRYFYAAWFNAGQAAEAAGNNTEAERYYREALKVRPDYGPALSNLFLLLNRTGKASAANKVVDDALASHGDRSGPHLAAAMRAYVARQPKKVKEEALAAIRIDERQVPAMRLMGWVFYEQKKYETARFAIENALALEPGNGLLHLDHGHTLLKLKEPDKAEEAFRKAAALRPELAEAQENFGVLALKSGNKPAALAALEKAATLRPQDAKAQLHLGNALRANAKYEEAEAAYKKALELDPELHAVHYNLGIMYLDNEIPEMDELVRLETSVASLDTFSDKASPKGEVADRLKDYQKTLKKKIKREKKKRKRAEERKAIEAEEKARKEAEAKAAAEKAPAEGGAAPTEGGEGAAGGNPGEGGAVEGEAGAEGAPPPAEK